MKQYYKYKRTDRKDGWRVSNIDPLMSMIPFFLRSRTESQVAYRQVIELETADNFIKELKPKYPEINITIVVVAALVRMLATRPYINRFVINNKLYARNSIKLALAVKQNMSDDAPENMSMTEFEPEDTIFDVMEKFSKSIESNRVDDVSTGTNKAMSILKKFPSFLFRFAVKVLFFLDKHGWLPKTLINISPWHCTGFITSMGSIGVDSVYHHLYEFGTSSFFVSIGMKSKNYVMNEEENLVPKRSIEFKFVIDERICDGFYYGKSMRQFMRIMNNPYQLLEPPEEVIVDNGVGRERIN